jgi:spore maturation protein CgeB
MLVGHFGIGTLAQSYKVAFEEAECELFCFDINSAVEKYCRFGTLGRKFNEYMPVEAWARKANREMVVNARQFIPQLVVVVGSCPVTAGALAQIKASLEVTLVHLWPDTLVNLGSSLLECLPLYDLECVYSLSAVEPIRRLGASRPVWMPLAGDPSIHDLPHCTESEADEYGADVAFIGGWRPEREAVLSTLTQFNLKIWGPDWGRRCKNNPAIIKAWRGRPLRGRDFAKAVACSKVNLNIIDQTNYPAANMRFFEIPCAGGLQMCSPCPEMEPEFKHGETTFYYRNESELSGQIRHLLGNSGLCQEAKHAAYRKVMENHTYLHRVKQILSLTAKSNQATLVQCL